MVATEGKTIGELVAEAPLRANVFEKRRIDYCCNGRRTVQEVCDEKNIAVEELIAELEVDPREEAPTDWRRQTLTALADHIIRRHHDYLRSTLPSAAFKLDKVVKAHGAKHDFLPELERTFKGLEVTSHMAKEERERSSVPLRDCA